MNACSVVVGVVYNEAIQFIINDEPMAQTKTEHASQFTGILCYRCLVPSKEITGACHAAIIHGVKISVPMNSIEYFWVLHPVTPLKLTESFCPHLRHDRM